MSDNDMQKQDLTISGTASANNAAGAKARLRTKMRIAWITLGLFAVGGIGAGFVAGSADRLDAWMLAIAAISILFLLGLGLIGRLAKRGMPDGARFLRDDLQRRRLRSLYLFPLFALVMSWGVWHSAGKFVDRTAHARDYFTLGCVFLLVLTYLQIFTTFRTGPVFKALHDDELSRHLRGRAVLFGYGVFFCGGIGVFFLGVADPALAVRAIPLLLLWAVSVTVFSYAVMDQRAGRDG